MLPNRFSLSVLSRLLEISCLGFALLLFSLSNSPRVIIWPNRSKQPILSRIIYPSGAIHYSHPSHPTHNCRTTKSWEASYPQGDILPINPRKRNPPIQPLNTKPSIGYSKAA